MRSSRTLRLPRRQKQTSQRPIACLSSGVETRTNPLTSLSELAERAETLRQQPTWFAARLDEDIGNLAIPSEPEVSRPDIKPNQHPIYYAPLCSTKH